MTGFYRNMSTGDYDEYRDTEEVTKEKFSKHSRSKRPRREEDPEDLRPVGDDDYEY